MDDPIHPSTHEPMQAQANLSFPDQPRPSGPSGIQKVFIGTEGLRSGWGILIFIVLMTLAFAGITALGSYSGLVPKNRGAVTDIPPRFVIFAELLPFLGTLLVTWIMSKIEGRPNEAYGLGGERKIPQFFAGMGWGVTCLSLLFLILWKTGYLVVDSRLLFGSDVLVYGAIWLGGFLLVGLFEEYFNRGYLLFTLTRGLASIYAWLFKTRHSKALGFWTAAVAISILFGLGHGTNPGESPIGLLSAGLASAVFCFSLWRTGSLWWAIGFHATWDWAQSFLYGVADSGLMVQHRLLATHPVGKPLMSGGVTGPEGSIFILLVLAIIILVILFTLPNKGYGDFSWNREIRPAEKP